jgi:hypothetical protein
MATKIKLSSFIYFLCVRHSTEDELDQLSLIILLKIDTKCAMLEIEGRVYMFVADFIRK